MENKELLHKYEKASKYSKEKDIYTLNNIEVSMRSKHSNRIISYNALS